MNVYRFVPPSRACVPMGSSETTDGIGSIVKFGLLLGLGLAAAIALPYVVQAAQPNRRSRAKPNDDSSDHYHYKKLAWIAGYHAAKVKGMDDMEADSAGIEAIRYISFSPWR